MKLLPTTVFLLILTSAACTRYVEPATKSSGGTARSEREDTGRRALRHPRAIPATFREQVHFPADRADAVGYRFDLHRGQKVSITLSNSSGENVLAEVFEEIGPGEPIFRLVQSATSRDAGISFEATTDGPHVLRLQPELSGGAVITISIATTAGLAFPVLGKSSRAINSYFGDARDGGKRDHEGIDIFAPAGTSVVAVAAGVITKANTTKLGGKVVWQHDPERNVTYYYAHLKSQNVRRGDRVSAGDMIGTVGNTGNARTTAPHLHFAVYRAGHVAIDPVPFLYDPTVGSATTSSKASD